MSHRILQMRYSEDEAESLLFADSVTAKQVTGAMQMPRRNEQWLPTVRASERTHYNKLVTPAIFDSNTTSAVRRECRTKPLTMDQ